MTDLGVCSPAQKMLTKMVQTSRATRVLSRLTSLALNAHALAAFISFLVFLVNGRYRTLLDRLLCMRLSTQAFQVRREVSFEYLNRQLVWHAFTEFLLFLLPLVGISRWRKWLSQAWRKANTLAHLGQTIEGSAERTGELGFLPERTCAICYHDQDPSLTSQGDVSTALTNSGGVVGSAQTDITNPYQASCGCIYCFVCIATKLDSGEGDGWTCLRCGNHITSCRPWNGDVMQDQTIKKVIPTEVT